MDSWARSPTVSDTVCWTCPTSLVIRDISWPQVRSVKNAAGGAGTRQEVQANDGPGGDCQTLAARQHAVEDGPDERGKTGRPDRVHEHPAHGRHPAAPVRRRVAEQAFERMHHSVNRYFTSVQIATTPSL